MHSPRLPLCLAALILALLPELTLAATTSTYAAVTGFDSAASSGARMAILDVESAGECIDYCRELPDCTMATFFPAGPSAGSCYPSNVKFGEARFVDQRVGVNAGVQLLLRERTCSSLRNAPLRPFDDASCVDYAFDDQVALNKRAAGTSRRTEEKSYDMRCPTGLAACPIGRFDGYECIDPMEELEQCGGCLGHGGVNCLDLPGVEAVACAAGVCEVNSCRFGFRFDHETGQCAPVTE